MHGLFKSFCLILLFFQILQSAYPAEEKNEKKEAYAKVMFTAGTVQVFKEGKEEAIELKRGDSVLAGERVTTGPKSKAVLITRQKKVIPLAANAELRIGEEKGNVIEGIGLGMFASGKGRSRIGAQAATRRMDTIPLLLYPRNSKVRDEQIELKFAELSDGERYEIEIVGIVPQFVYHTILSEDEFLLSAETIGHSVLPGETYYVYVRKLNAEGMELVHEYGLRIGMLAPDIQETVENVEQTLEPLSSDESDNLAYPTLLAETYETYCLYQEAIESYERILNDMNPGDSYALDRLEYLYIVTKDSAALKQLAERKAKTTEETS